MDLRFNNATFGLNRPDHLGLWGSECFSDKRHLFLVEAIKRMGSNRGMLDAYGRKLV